MNQIFSGDASNRAKQHNDPQYSLNLVVRVRVEAAQIVTTLPALQEFTA